MIVEENHPLGDDKCQAGQGADRRTYDGRESKCLTVLIVFYKKTVSVVSIIIRITQRCISVEICWLINHL